MFINDLQSHEQTYKTTKDKVLLVPALSPHTPITNKSSTDQLHIGSTTYSQFLSDPSTEKYRDKAICTQTVGIKCLLTANQNKPCKNVNKPSTLYLQSNLKETGLQYYNQF